MWKQITTLNGDEIYLIVSLWIFLVFFIAVAVMLFTMKKDFVHYMKNIPLDEEADKTEESSQ